MKKAVIIYHSRTGTTKKYGEEIGDYLTSKGIEAQVTSTIVFRNEILEGADYIFFGCWTSGLMFILQKPEKAWVEFAERLPNKHEAKIALFTTYKILTGSMFRNMIRHLDGKYLPPSLELKSRDGLLSAQNKQSLDQFIT